MLSGTQRVRLGTYGGTRQPYASFAGRATAAVVVVTARTGGIGHRYPRKISMRGRIYSVNNADDERRLLNTWAEHVADEAAVLKVLGDMDTAEKAFKFVQKLNTRIAKTDDREAAWLQRLRDEDEEILTILLH